MPNNLSQFWLELKRRKVVRVITVYAGAAFVILELVDIIAEPLKLPSWLLPVVIVLLSIGFIISVILSWVYDITPEGVKKTSSAFKVDHSGPGEKSGAVMGWKIATYASIAVIAGLILMHIFSTGKSLDLSGLERSVAVLPFQNLSPGVSETSLQDAIPIALSMELRNIEGFKVPSWKSTSTYKETSLKMPDIGAELEVNYILIGTVQEQEGIVRVDMEFIHALSGEVIWSDSEEMVLKDIFQLQRDISAHVASALKSNFHESREIITENPDAYLAFLTGEKFYHTDETEQDFRQAIKFYEKAVHLDPDFFLAYVKISTSSLWMYHMNYDRTTERLSMAQEALNRARAFDPDNPEVKLASGLYYYVTYEYDKALNEFEGIEDRVLDKFELYISMASIYRRRGEMDRAIHYFQKCAEVDPQSRIPRLEMGETFLLKRDYQTALKYLDQYQLMGGTVDETLMNKTLLYLNWKVGTGPARLAFEEARSFREHGYSPNLTHYGYLMDLIDGHYEEALNRLNAEEFEVLDDQFLYIPKSIYLGNLYRIQNKIEESKIHYDSARIHLEDKIRETPGDPRYRSTLGIALAGIGLKHEAIEEGERALSLMPVEKDYYRGIFMLEDMARICTMAGEYDEAIRILDRLLSRPSHTSCNLLKKDPTWKPLWDLPEFNQLLDTYPEQHVR
jgi:serine/threonine-protein kinase